MVAIGQHKWTSQVQKSNASARIKSTLTFGSADFGSLVGTSVLVIQFVAKFEGKLFVAIFTDDHDCTLVAIPDFHTVKLSIGEAVISTQTDFGWRLIGATRVKSELEELALDFQRYEIILVIEATIVQNYSG